jgi:hypothetical protein
MRNFAIVLVLLLLAGAGMAQGNPAATAKPSTTPTAKPKPAARPVPKPVSRPAIVLFAVWPPSGEARPQAILDPVVVVRGSRLLSPSNYAEGDIGKGKPSDLFDRMEEKYYEYGKQYSLLSGGAEAGTVTISKRTKLGCFAAPAVETSPALEAWQTALTPSTVEPPLQLHPDWRSTVTPEQRSAIATLAALYMDSKRVFLPRRKIAVPMNVVAKVPVPVTGVTVEHAIATKLDKTDKPYWIASVTVKQEKAIHHVFMVVTTREGNYVPSLVLDHVNRHPDNTAGDLQETLVGQVDLDGDGLDELVTMSWYSKYWNYSIYKRRHGVWRRVYRGGGGGGC